MPLNRRPYTGPTKLVLAFDIGTTHSGVSYCILKDEEVPRIFEVTKFLSQEPVRDNARVPSVLYYDRNGSVRAVGAEVFSEYSSKKALSEGWTKAEWWKLHLRPSHLASSINPDNDLPPLPPGKSVVDVLADFIRYLFRCSLAYIRRQHHESAPPHDEHSTEYIFTYPNGWEGLQQQLYRQAIERAGLIPDTPEGQSRIHMLTDGEASLHFCVLNLLGIETNYTTDPQGILIVDAGGGTIDLSMYSVTSNTISCKEVAPADCRLQGSVFVTCQARDLLRRKLDGWEHFSPDEITELTRKFDQSAKLSIRNRDEPAYIRLDGPLADNSQYNILHGNLMLSGAEATSLFNVSIDNIIAAFEQQQKWANARITTAFFFGGLSANDWVWSQLERYFNSKGIHPLRSVDIIYNTVSIGALLSYVDPDNRLIPGRVARATYGVVHAVPVKINHEEHLRRKNRWETDTTGDQYVPGYFESKIRKGTHVSEDIEFRCPFSLAEDNIAKFGVQTVRVLCYRGSLPDPKWVDQDQSSFSIFCTIRVDLSVAARDLAKEKTDSGQVHYRLDYDVIIFFGPGEVRGELAWTSRGGQRRIPARVSFIRE